MTTLQSRNGKKLPTDKEDLFVYQVVEPNARTADGASWILYLNSLPAGDYDFAGLAYGDNRFIAVTTDGTTLYSLDKGTTFKTGTSIPQLGGVDLHVKDFKYLQGVFMAVGDLTLELAPQHFSQDEIDRCATTEDGLIWTERNPNNNARLYSTIAPGNFSNVGTFVVLGDSKQRSPMRLQE